MIKIENVEIWGIEHAIRGMRNPLNSWDKSDSEWRNLDENFYGEFVIGRNDFQLMQKLFRAGTEHRKYLRQIFVSMDITSNHTWWQEFDTYKIGITRNSCSKMHTIHIKEFVPDDFSHEGIDEVGGVVEEHFLKTIEVLEWLRVKFNETHEKKYWRAIIELLPMGYNLKATVTMNYENIFNIIKQREGHKMFEWNILIDTFKTFPCVKEFLYDYKRLNKGIIES